MASPKDREVRQRGLSKRWFCQRPFVLLLGSNGSFKLCVRCIKCHGCGSPDVVDWINLKGDMLLKTGWLCDSLHPNLRPFCQRCFQLRESKNFCPLCQGCYEDDDFDSKMMECGKCKEWVHAQCEGITDEWYQILSFLPDSVEFVCKLCLQNGQSQWIEAIKNEMQEGLKAVFNSLYGSKFAKHLIQISVKNSLNSKKVKLTTLNASINSKSFKEIKSEVTKQQPEEKEVNASSESELNELSVNILVHDKTDSQVKSLTHSTPANVINNKIHLENTNQIDCTTEENHFNSSLLSHPLELDVNSSTNLQQQNEEKIFDRPLTRSCKSISNTQIVINDSSSQNCLKPRAIDGAGTIFPRDEFNLKQCSVRLEDICKIKKEVSGNNIEHAPLDSARTTTRNQKCVNLTKSESLEYKEHGKNICLKNYDAIIQPNHSKLECIDFDKNISSGKDKFFTVEAKKLSEKLLTPLKNFISCYMSDFEDDEETKKAKKNSPYSVVAKVSKDIDDDCISSEESSFCSSDTEIESIFDDPYDPKDFQDVKNKLNENKYESVIHFHVDILRIIEMGKSLNKVQTRNIKSSYIKFMKEKFPWFNIRELNIFTLIDIGHPFPIPYSDHNYSNLRISDRASSSLSWKHSSSGTKLEVSPFKTHSRIRNTSSPSKKLKSGQLLGTDPRKCLLCNASGDADPQEAGRLLYLGQDEWLHVNCGLWSSEVYEEEDGGLQNVYIAVSRGRQIKCSLCQERGATVGCCYKSCQATYHFMCARNSRCFFGEDKRIFCQSHTTCNEDLKCIEDLRVGRCVFVNMDFEKRRWRQAITNKVNVIIGSLFINSLGKMVSDIDFEDALIPADFCCSRMYWSTRDPTKRVKYFCRTRLIYPTHGSMDVLSESMFHKTIDHSLSLQMIEKEMAELKVWQKEMDRQKWERQSRHTNIIPPHMCPLYRNILREERKGANQESHLTSTRKRHNPTRRQLFSPFISTPSDERENENDVRLCVDDILNRISQPENPPEVQEESEISPVIQSLDENDMNIPSTDENSEMMASIVNADDNEIISMVLKDLAVFESSVFQSTPSTSGRASPLDLDFLAVCDPTINSDEKHSYDLDPFKQERKTPQKSEEKEKYRSSYVEKSFLEEPDNAEAQLICQKILEACDPQMQNQIITYDQDNSIGHNNPIELYSVVPAESVHHATGSYIPNLGSGSASLHLNSISHEMQNHINCQFPVTQHSYDHNNHIYETNSNIVSNSHAHEVMGARGIMYSQHAQKGCYSSVGSSSDCKSKGVDVYSLEDCKGFFMPDNLNQTGTQCYSNIFQPGNGFNSNIEEFNQPTHSSSFQANSNPSSYRVCEEESAKINMGLQNSYEDSHLRSTEREKNFQSLPRDVTRPASVPLDSSENHLFTHANSSGSSCSSAKQVCRVLPMLSSSAGSRRGSSASDHSDSGNFPLNQIKSPPTIEGSSSAENIRSVSENPAGEVEKKKRKIHMKRNYRTVIKKYPLRSAFRKRTPYKTVQIEINETIEIPSEDETVCRRSLKRKWSSEVIKTKSEPTSEAKCSSRRGRRSFRSSDTGNNARDYDPLSEPNGTEKETQNKDENELPRSNSKRSHQVLKFSDDHNAITVSIVNNNNLCDFAKRKRRHRFRRKTVLQLDGAADDSSSDAASNEDQPSKQTSHPMQSNLAFRIKQQSLARSSPGEEGPFKCSKCKRLYRTKDSYNRHIETCNFEIDSSTSSEEGDKDIEQCTSRSEISNNVNINRKQNYLSENIENKVSPLNVIPKSNLNRNHLESNKYMHFTPPSNENTILPVRETEVKMFDSTDIKKLEDMCSSTLLEGSFSAEKMHTEESKAEMQETERLPGIHRQVRIAMRRSSDMKAECDELKPTRLVSSQQSPSGGSEVFVPPTLSSPIKFNPVVKKSSSPRRYTNVRLFKGRQGYQYRRAPPQLLTSQHQQQQQHEHLQPQQQTIQSQQQILNQPQQQILNQPQQQILNQSQQQIINQSQQQIINQSQQQIIHQSQQQILQQSQQQTLHQPQEQQQNFHQPQPQHALQLQQQNLQPQQQTLQSQQQQLTHQTQQHQNINHQHNLQQQQQTFQQQQQSHLYHQQHQPDHRLRQEQQQQLQHQQHQQFQNQLAQEHSYLPQTQMQFQTSQLQFRGQDSSLPITIQPVLDQGTFRVQSTSHPSSQFQNPMNAALPQITRDLGTNLAPLAQVMAVVSGPSVAIPQGYTLQYVGSFREGEIRNASNLLAYQSSQPVVVPSSLMVAPQQSPMVMPQVVNTNITYTIAAPEALVLNQSAVVPGVHYVAPQQQQAFQQPLIQTLGTVVPFNQSGVQTMQHINSSIQSLPQSMPSIAVHHLSAPDKEIVSSSPVLPPCSTQSMSVNLSQNIPSSPCNRPQAFIAPISSDASKEPPRCLKIETSPTSSSRPLFGQTASVTRSVATVAPAVFTTSTVVSKLSLSNSSSNKQSIQTSTVKDCLFVNTLTDIQSRIAAIRPRPTYSYRDAMKGALPERKRPRSDNEKEDTPPVAKKKDGKSTDEENSDSEKINHKQVEDKNTNVKEIQSYKLVLKKDNQSGSKFNILPLSGPKVPLPSPEVKELRIKAKVSVGPKRKKASGSNNINHHWGQCGKDFMIANKDTTNDLLVNEQTPNLSLNFSPSQPISDEGLIDKPKTTVTEPYIIFELTSEDGFKVESRQVSEVWQKVFDAVSEARDNLRLGVKGDNGGTGNPEAKGKSLSGLHMLGLTHSAVQYLLEQLPGAKDCHKYSFQFHRRPTEDDTFESASGCARSESFKTRSPYDVFSWLASKHRRLPLKSLVQQEEIQLSTRRATSLELPMAMRYRHLCETAREAVGVFRSSIHGRGLFCKREIDAGEMVIEYAGQVIRSCLCDMREKFYESKGIGCYMFRIDEETVIDATMHGNAARFINHSCDPNCYSRVVDILGKKHIIIFALRRIQRGEELTYDYKFPIEDDKIPCSCGARRCRKYLN